MIKLLDPPLSPRAIEALCGYFDQPRHLPIRGRERRWLETLTLHHFDTPAGRGRLYESGPKDAPAILLVHGWGGYTGMFALLASHLKTRGYRVVLPDLLGHGDASPDCARHFGAQLTWLKRLLYEVGPCQHVIGHSLGGLLATLLHAMPSSPFRSTTLLGSPQSLTHAFQHFVAQIQHPTPPGIAEKLARWYCTEHALPSFCMTHHGRSFTQHALFIHGGNDHRFDSRQAHASHQACTLPAEQKQLIIYDRLGHLGILYSTEIHHTICTFIDHAQESEYAM
ncbi:TPA: alpha/beta hydrolase [Serratia fonticola]